MTVKEFKKQGFRSGDKARYKDGNIYDIASVDFEEQLIGLLMNIPGAEDPDDISWVRCENVQYIPATQPTEKEKGYFQRLKEHPGIGFAIFVTSLLYFAALGNKSLSTKGALIVATVISLIFPWGVILISNRKRKKRE